ncbi:hypothetical protein HPB52_004662 [Rhipicephalus sanguineus]|uniref:Uncharacterized protein n=1 Tax=Rhipicephalus sanguineus TaxID=34632 RepID=A0A9D4QDE9_RHISA|nr:hypothetical protein HPB52_004662 [Rhipicephalus sanguineus]
MPCSFTVPPEWEPAWSGRFPPDAFEYRGVRVRTVRVLGYPADASDSALLNGLAAYGKVLGMDYEHVPEFKTVLTGNRRVRFRDGANPFPNLLPVGSRIVQVRDDGAFFPGTTRLTARSHSASVCAEFGHARCEAGMQALWRRPCFVCLQAVQLKARRHLRRVPEGSPLPETEPVRAEAPGGGEQGTRPELAEASDPSAALPPPAASTDVPAAPADVPAVPAAEEDQGETMDAEPWRLVRGKRRRARSSDSSDERPAEAACGGPGGSEEGLPGVKRTAAADSDSESTQSTVKDSTEGETSLFSSSCPYCGLGTCDGDCSPLSDRVYSSTHEDSSSDEESSQ